MGLFNIVSFIAKHPLNKDRKFAAISNFFKWQVISRVYNRPMIVPFVEDSKIIVKKGMAAATGNMYCGLMEFEDMGFLLHFLRPGDVFADVGANIGSYTILASSVAKATTYSFEPIPSTFKELKNNITVNDIEDLVKLFNAGVGETDGVLRFTNSFDSVNHVVLENTVTTETIEVPTVKLDNIFREEAPALIKIDVEGFELGVLKGGSNTLRNPVLKAIIIEINGCCRQFGVKEDDIHHYLLSFGFKPHAYDPLARTLKEIENYNANNTIYLREFPFVRSRIQDAQKRKVFNVSF